MLILGISNVKAYFNNYKYFKIACCLKLKMNKKDDFVCLAINFFLAAFFFRIW